MKVISICLWILGGGGFLLLILFYFYLIIIKISYQRPKQNKDNYSMLQIHLKFFESVLNSKSTSYDNIKIILMSESKINLELLAIHKDLMKRIIYNYTLNWEEIGNFSKCNVRSLRVYTVDLNNFQSWNKIIKEGIDNKLPSSQIRIEISKINQGRYMEETTLKDLNWLLIKRKLE